MNQRERLEFKLLKKFTDLPANLEELTEEEKEFLKKLFYPDNAHSDLNSYYPRDNGIEILKELNFPIRPTLEEWKTFINSREDEYTLWKKLQEVLTEDKIEYAKIVLDRLKSPEVQSYTYAMYTRPPVRSAGYDPLEECVKLHNVILLELLLSTALEVGFEHTWSDDAYKLSLTVYGEYRRITQSLKRYWDIAETTDLLGPFSYASKEEVTKDKKQKKYALELFNPPEGMIKTLVYKDGQWGIVFPEKYEE